jgi:TonB family protein
MILLSYALAVVVMTLSMMWSQVAPAQEKPPAQAAPAQEPSPAEQEYQRGRVAMARGNVDDAIKAFQEALKKDENHADAHYYLGLAYTRKAQWKEAEPEFRRAIEARNSYPEAYLGLAGCLYFQRDYQNAMTSCQKAIEQRGPGEFASAHNLVGLIYFRQDQYRAAAEAFQKAVEQRPRYPDAECSLGDALWLQPSEGMAGGEGKTVKLIANLASEQTLGKSIAAYKAAIEQQANFARAHRQLGLALIGVNREEAIRALEGFLQQQPSAEEASWIRSLVDDLKKISELHLYGEAGLSDLKLLSQPVLEWTSQARDNRIEGMVTLGAVFAADGQVKAVYVIKGLGVGMDQKAVDAAKQIKFEPATKDGKPVSVLTTIRIAYKLT